MENKFFIDVHRFNQERNQKRLDTIRKHLLLVDTPEECDYILVLGGDGTLLEQIFKYKDYEKPFLPLHGGTIGYYMQNLIKCDGQFIDSEYIDILKFGKFFIERAPMLNVKSTGQDGTVVKEHSFGDVWVERSTPRSLRFQISIKCDDVSMFSSKDEFINGDGILACTPIGSTGYYRQIAGCVIPFGVSCFGVAPQNATLNKHRLSNFVLDKNNSIHIDILDGDFRTPRLIVDGQDMSEIQNKTFVPVSIDIRMSKTEVKLAYTEDNFLHKKSLSYLMS